MFNDFLQKRVKPAKLLEASSCPVSSKAYGGLPANGGISPVTEYLVGAAQIAEAAHCIIGSIHRVVDDEGSLKRDSFADSVGIELGHLKEEIGKIKKAQNEKQRDLYISPEGVMHSPDGTADEIFDQLPKLRDTAEKLRQQVDLDNQLLEETAKQAYRVIEILSQSLIDSAEVYKENGEWTENGFRNRELTNAIRNLEQKIAEIRRKGEE
jgi:hypothetical protein